MKEGLRWKPWQVEVVDGTEGTDVAVWERELEIAEEKVAALRLVVRGLRALNGDSAQLRTLRTTHTAREGLLALLADGRTWTRKEIVAEFVSRGWLMQKANHNETTKKLDTALSKAVEAGTIERVGHATYRLLIAAPPPAPKPETRDEGGAQ